MKLSNFFLLWIFGFFLLLSFDLFVEAFVFEWLDWNGTNKNDWFFALSFTAPIKGSVYTKPDNSYGMRRTEIRSVTSDIHLGHVFPDGPNGMPRYCINATVLDFKPRDDLS